MHQIYLSRRNLLILLSKLDRRRAGETTYCTIIKRDTVHPLYPTTSPTLVTAVEDNDYYDRAVGQMHPADEAAIPAESTPRPEGASTTTTIAPRGQRRTPCQEN